MKLAPDLFQKGLSFLHCEDSKCSCTFAEFPNKPILIVGVALYLSLFSE